MGKGAEDAGGVGGAGENGFDMGDGFRNGALRSRGKRKGKREGLRANGEQIGAPGDAVVELAAHQEQ